MSESLFPSRWAEDRPPSLEKFTSDFGDDYACAEYLAKKRWRDGFKCSKCGGNRAWRLEARPWVWECQGVLVDVDGGKVRTRCRHQTSLISGTIMHGTHLPLRKWFLAAYFLATHSNGMSALQLQAKLGITSYKSAWLLLHKLRRAMVDPNRRPLRGDVEMDETNIPFRKKTDPLTGGQGRSPVGKLVLVGAVEIVDRFYAGRMRLQRVEVAVRETLQRFILNNTAPSSNIITDGYSAYQRPPERTHKAHSLSAKNALPAHIVLKWVHRIFSNFKRWAVGKYHGLREKHIYCNEFVFRWNRRRSFQTSIDTLLGIGQRIGRATWRDIVGNTRKWKFEHRNQVLKMVSPRRLRQAQDLAHRTGLDIFDALDEVRKEEPRHDYHRRRPTRAALPPRRPGEERNTRRYLHPPSLDSAELRAGYLRHVPPTSKIMVA